MTIRDIELYEQINIHSISKGSGDSSSAGDPMATAWKKQCQTTENELSNHSDDRATDDHENENLSNSRMTPVLCGG